MTSLACENLSAGYGGAIVLRDVSLSAASGRVLAVAGRNGAGKTTLMKALFGLLPLQGGMVRLNGADAAGMRPFQRARAGMGYSPQERCVFDALSVRRNLILTRSDESLEEFSESLAAFPRLRERLNVSAGRLSGGEKKLLAFVRALSEPERTVILLDEPTEGVQRENIEKMADIARRRASAGTAFIIAEQNLNFLAECADSAVFLDRGEIIHSRDKFSAQETAEWMRI